ncbi:MAG: 1-deoxy-D-xylulose-5-phosphate reductoisomerase, partial [Paracoccaceae bacterium]
DEARHPALRLSRDVIDAGGLAGAVFNAAKERALDGFIDGGLGFLQMAEVVEETLDRLMPEAAPMVDMSLDDVLAMDAKARRVAGEIIAAL